MREAIAARQAELDKRAAELDRSRESVGSVADYETYLESAPKAYRGWVEAMRGSSLSDDEFRQEAADFVTLMSADVLGVKLPDEVKAQIEAKLTRKALSAYKANTSRKEQAESAKREAARVDGEWREAARVLDGQFKVDDTSKAYPWLAAEESPGSIVVDVIKSAQRRDGTVLSWQEASKQANDYLKKQVSGAFDRRKHLLSAAPAQSGDAAPKQASATGRPSPGSSQVTRPPPNEPASTSSLTSKGVWDKEAHRRKTRAAFAASFKPED